MTHLRWAVLILALAGAAGSVRGADGPQRQATLSGMPRAEVVALLGDPDRAKGAGDGETLVFKLRRAPDDYMPAANERVVLVPDVGLCIVTSRPLEHGVREEVTIEPTTMDNKGRMNGGGVSTSQSRTITLKKGERSDAVEAPGTAVPGPKLRLKLVLDAGGRVREWNVKP